MGLLIASSPPPPPPPVETVTVLRDGDATAHQIAVRVDGTGYSQGTQATMRYRPTGGAWVTGHDLYRIQPSVVSSGEPSPWTISDQFAWPIIDLEPDTEYEVEVTIDGGIGTLTTTTKALPPAAGTPDTIVNSGNIASLQTIINSAAAGDVIQIANGTYTVENINLSSSNGTAANPVYVRGESRDGVILQKSTGGAGNAMFQFTGTTNGIVFENFTAEGSGGTGTTSEFFGNFATGGAARDITLRNITATGFRRGIYMYYLADRWLVYDCTFEGRNPWTIARYGSNLTWDDYGAQICGHSNEIFNVTLRNFGDTLQFGSASDSTLSEPYNNHIHNCAVWNSCDDTHEADRITRNNSMYDCRITNCQNLSSLQPHYAGPLLHARNIYINVARSRIHKWNNDASGMFFYNCTSVATGSTIAAGGFPAGAPSVWDQPNGSSQEYDYFGIANNIHISGDNTTNILTLNSPSGMNNVDWRSNSWYPDNAMNFGNPGNYSSVANANSSSTTNFTPVFGSQTRFVETDLVSEQQPFVTPVVLGADESTEVTIEYYPILSGSSVNKNSGVVIPGVTDGFTGAAPDRGAVIEGRAQPVYGDQSVTTATRLQEIADAIPAGGSNINISELENTQTGYTGTGNGDSSEYDISWCDNVVYYDETRQELQYMGKPQSSFSDATYNYVHYIYDEATETWSRPTRSLGNTTGHLYGSTSFHEGDYYVHAWAENQIRRYDRATSTWTTTSTNGNLPGGYDWMAGAVFHPNAFGAGDGGYIACPSFSSTARVWRVSDNTWYDLANVSALQEGGPNFSSGAQGIYVPGLDTAVIGGEGGNVYQVPAGSGGSLGTAVNVGVSSVNFGWDVGMPSNWFKLVVDPNNSSRLLALECGSTYEVYASTNGADSWTLVGNHPFSTTGGYSQGPASFTTIAPYGVIACTTSDTIGAGVAHKISLWKPNV